MKYTRRIRALFLAVTLLCCTVLFSACGEQGASGSNEPAYKVTVKDALGNPYASGVIVRFMQNGTQAAMQVADENGVAEKVLAKGDYTVELKFTNSDIAYYYDRSDLTLSADKMELEIVLSYALGENSQTLHAQGKDTAAYPVSTGCTYVDLTAGQRNYFLFSPAEAGTYQFSVVGSDAAIGYYGAPHFVQESSAAEVVDNTFTISVKSSMIGTGDTGTSVFVIGVDAADEASCILAIERIGDPEHTLEDEPWTVYQTTAKLAPYTLPAGAQLGEFDLTKATDAYNLVYNEADGFYHLDSADGPLVLVRLGEASQYLDSFKTILEHSGVVKYFFDENGAFVKKESYSECLLEYIGYEDQGTGKKVEGYMDPDTGLYPLTEDLKYIIQQRGEYSGWFDPTDSLYLFKDQAGNIVPGINNEIAWLFMCCYIAA